MRNFNVLLSTFAVFSHAYLLSYASGRSVDNKLEQHTTVIADLPENCLYIISTPGHYSYNSTTGKDTVCGIYLAARADELIRITFTEFDVPCGADGKTSGSLVQYTDGWELNGQVFPPADTTTDNNSDETEFCSSNSPIYRTFVSSQNGALISYRILEGGKGFTISVEHQKHPSPCNVIYSDDDYVVLKNHGNQINCTYWIPDKVKVKFNSYSIGNSKLDADASNKCRDSSDRIEVGGSGGLDTNHIEVLDTVCNKSGSNGDRKYFIDCSTTTIKLVSSGAHDNYLNVTVTRLDPEESSSTSTKYQCSSLLN